MSFSKIFETITEIVGWLQIVLSFLLIGGFLGWLLYLNYPNTYGIAGAVLLVVAGFVFGIWRATRAFKGKGTMWLLSRVDATPELDPEEEEENSGKP